MISPGLGQVLLDLGHQVQQGFKNGFRPQAIQELDRDGLTIEVQAGIEQEGFDIGFWTFVLDRWPDTDIGDRLVGAIANPGPGRIDTIGRNGQVRINGNIGGRKSQFAAQFLALDHGSGHGKRKPETAFSQAGVTFSDQATDPRTGNFVPVQTDFRHHNDFTLVLLTPAAQEMDIPFPTLAKAVVLAHHNQMGVQSYAQDVVQEFDCRHGCKLW